MAWHKGGLIALTLASCSAAQQPGHVAVSPETGGVTYREDVIYGRVEGAALLADVAYPDGPGPFPAIISIHGGRWVAGNRRDTSSIKVRDWAAQGFFAMSIDYRLAKSSPAPACY